MNLDLGSWVVRLDIGSEGSTPSWGTALGQKKDYSYSIPDSKEYKAAMDGCAIPVDKVTCPMGKGGNQQDNYKIIRAALFEKIYLHYGKRTIILLKDAKFILIELQQLHGVHTGRKTIKYSKQNQYIGEKIELTNEECFQAIEKSLKIKPTDGWFVRTIEFQGKDQIHFYVYVIPDGNNKKYATPKARREAMLAAISEHEPLVSHYTSLDAAISLIGGVENECLRFRASRYDCLNDPNECRYGVDLLSKAPAVKPYILSFCSSSDNPVMWRLYDSKIQFVFSKDDIIDAIDENKTEEVDLTYDDVSYYNLNDEKDRFREELEKLSEEDRDLRLTLVKHSDYDIEKEWRIVAIETKKYKKETKTEDFSKKIIGCGSAFGMVKMYREIQIPVHSLKEIIVYEFNPSQYSLIEAQIKDLLEIKQIKNVNIRMTACAGVRRK